MGKIGIKYNYHLLRFYDNNNNQCARREGNTESTSIDLLLSILVLHIQNRLQYKLQTNKIKK